MIEDNSLDDMPPNVAIVYHELKRNAPMTQKDLIEATNMPFRPVRDALNQLTEGGSIEELVYSHGRLRLYLFEESPPKSNEQSQAQPV